MTFVGWLSLMAWGLGYFGQPHIIVRFMAIRSVEEVPTARNIAMGWMAISLAGAVGVGLFRRAYVQRTGIALGDPATIFILLSDTLFPALVTGFLYAALLAAIMSSVSSQLLVSASSLAEDVSSLFADRRPGDRTRVMVGRLAVLGVGAVAAVIAATRTARSSASSRMPGRGSAPPSGRW